MSNITVNSMTEIVSSDAEEPSESASSEEETLAIFVALNASLLRYAVSFGLSVHDAEDLIQEVFLALFRHLRLGRSRSNLSGWVFTVTHNLALKRRLRLGTENRLMGDNSASAESYGDTAPNPEAQLLLDERQRRLRAIYNGLPERDQWCLRLRSEGLRYREIAQVVNISLGSVSSSLARSLARLATVDR